MECPDGCISQDACSDNTAYISTVIFLGLISFCAGQLCYIVSLRRKLYETDVTSEDNESQTLIENPPPYQHNEHM